MTDVLITPAELVRLREGQAVHVLDVRWRLDRPDGRDEYLAGHVPGAVYVDLERELAASATPDNGRHPLPSIAAMEASARRWGLRTGETVVVYDDLQNLSAARAWWLLRWAGVADVRLLDGAWRGWCAAGMPEEAGPVQPELGDVELRAGALQVIGIDEAAAFPGRGVLIDARAAERYRGEAEPIDPRAGHIPGAVSVPTAANVDAEGRFLPPDVLRDRFEAAGVTPDRPVAAYCGSGVTAAHEVVALTLAGFVPALYPGSWSQWSNRPGRPVATGDGDSTG